MKTNIKTLFALSAVPALALSAQAAVVAWDGGATGSWNTTTNWNPDGLPGSADDVTISNADVTIDEGSYNINSLSLINSSLDGIETGANTTQVLRWTNGGTVFNIDATSNFGASDDFFDMRGVSVNFDSGAQADLGTWETKMGGVNGFTATFNLDASGFTTINTGRLLHRIDSSGGDYTDYTWNVDFADYDFASGSQTITLASFAGTNTNTDGMSTANFQLGNLEMLNAGSFYGDSTLAWDEATDSVVLTIVAIPEPSSTALLGLGVSSLLLRRKRS